MTVSSICAKPPIRVTGFSLVELVIVIVIMSIIAAIAVPRAGHLARQAKVSALQTTLVHVRQSIDIYHAEHGKFPGYDPATGSPDGDWFVKQLTEYSDDSGKTNSTPTTTYIYGPYLRKPFPASPLNELSTVYVKKRASDPDPASAHGWVAVLRTGAFGVSATNDDFKRIGLEDAERIKSFRAVTTAAAAAAMGGGT